MINSFIEAREYEGVAASIGLIAGALAAGVVVYFVLFQIFRRLAARSDSPLDNILVGKWRGPGRLLLPLFMVLLVAPSLRLPAELLGILRHLFNLSFIAAIAWLLSNSILACRDIVVSRYDVDARDNLKARAVYTQINVLVKIGLVVIAIIAAASMLMTFEKIRQVGVSILASAGIAGVIIGFAAQKSLATLLAGIQIAVTRPILIDDVVIVEGEWGKIEEITLTYVVVQVWDLRRLVVPITYFLEKPFQNWTRASAELVGTVSIHTDYRVPVEEVRRELHRILQRSNDWDGKTWGLQVTNATDRTIELRAVMSAADAASNWNLRCEVRESLLAFVQRSRPESMPRTRVEIIGERFPEVAGCVT